MTPQEFKKIKENIKSHLEALNTITDDIEATIDKQDERDRIHMKKTLNLVKDEITASINQILKEYE